MSVTQPPFYTDADLRDVTPEQSVVWMREALKAHHQGRLVSPPRISQALTKGRVVYTVGELAGQWFGYRMYDTIPNGVNYQLVAVHDMHTGLPRAMHGGELLGPVRVGGIGGVALDVLASQDVSELAVVGTGTQAWHHVWAYSAVRDFGRVRVYSRDADRRAVFAARIERELGLNVQVAGSSGACVRGADVVVLATNSAVPVVDVDDLAGVRFVSSVGPKQVGRQEFPQELLTGAGWVVTDSLAQLVGYKPQHAASGMSVEELSSVVASGDSHVAVLEEVMTVFLSVGLAGTEPYLVDQLHRSRAGGELLETGIEDPKVSF